MLRIYRCETVGEFYYAISDIPYQEIKLNNIRPYVVFRGTRLMLMSPETLKDCDNEAELLKFRTCNEFSVHKFDGFLSIESLFDINEHEECVIKDVTNHYNDKRLLSFIEMCNVMYVEDSILSDKREQELKHFYEHYFRNYYEYNK